MKHYYCADCYFPHSRMIRHCDTAEFMPHSMPFPSVKLKDCLIADNIISLLTHPPSNTTLSLQEGDLVRNALLELATSLKQIEKLPEANHLQKHNTSSLRVEKDSHVTSPSPQLALHVTPSNVEDAISPRVQNNSTLNNITVQNLANRTNLPKNTRCNNSPLHSHRI